MIPEEWQTEVKSDTAALYKVLKGLMHDAGVESVVCATELRREGRKQYITAIRRFKAETTMRKLGRRLSALPFFAGHILFSAVVLHAFRPAKILKKQDIRNIMKNSKTIFWECA